jgi:U32 family peptidase
MKLVAPLANINDYEELVDAGADEFFCGFIPFDLLEQHNAFAPINRREFLIDDCNIGNFCALKILSKKIEQYKIPVKMTFNSLYYTWSDYPKLINLITVLIDLGFDTFIMADPALILYIKKRKIKCKIHLSGELGVLNHLTLDFFSKFNLSRYIFPGKSDIKNIENCILKANLSSSIEYEAFILNGWCTYLGAYCNTIHCDEMPNTCNLPYYIKLITNNDKYDVILRYLKLRNNIDNDSEFANRNSFYSLGKRRSDDYTFANGGCGLCRIFKLKEIGVTHLKIVGRGCRVKMLVRDIENIKQCILQAKLLNTEKSYIDDVKMSLFKGKCPAICYYNSDS